jgi:hypothetical protein
MVDAPNLTPEEIEWLREHGISAQEAGRQLELLSRRPRYIDLDRPCTPGDGIRVIGDDEAAELYELHEEAARGGRCVRFVPASGAASRMFRSLSVYREREAEATVQEIGADAANGSDDARAVKSFLDDLKRFAFAGDLRAVLAERGQDPDHLLRSGHTAAILRALLDDDGMGYATLPKGVLKFHAYPDGHRTPFEEHLVEVAAVLRRVDGVCRLHLTVSPEHRERFEALLERVRETYERAADAVFEVEFSEQRPSTDTLAVDPENRPFRLDDGNLLLRPAGHGALLDNLQALDGDLVTIKNIDNVVPDRLKNPTYHWTRVLVGCLVSAQRQVFDLLEHLESGSGAAMAQAVHFADEILHRELPATAAGASERERRTAMIRQLDRPIRVCGMVRNTGEPGGGPFWVRDPGGTPSLQIVETVQVDPRSATQQEILRSATHFNPVFMVCGVRNPEGEPYDLQRYVDPDTAIVTRKSAEGRELKALERPGLWNGSMAHWNTIFVEVPDAVFNPVKTVNDLLRDAHQPASG